MSQELFSGLEQNYNLPAGLLDAVWSAESGRGKYMLSKAGAQGHMGFMPATAKQYGVDPQDLTSSATGAARMYADLLKGNGGNLDRALAGYNWGQGNLNKKGLESAPKETRDYIQKVKASMGNDPWSEVMKKHAQGAEVADSQPGSDAWSEVMKKHAQAVDEPTAKTSDLPKTQNPMMVKAGNIGNDIAQGVMRAGRDFIDGPAYVLPKGLGFLSGAGGLLPNRVSDYFNQEAAKVSDQNKAAESAYQAATPGSVAAGAARAVGNIIPFVMTGGSSGLSQGANAASKGGVVSSMLQGGALGGLLGTKDDTSSFLGNAALGAGAAGLLNVLGTGLKAGITPSGASNAKQLETLRANQIPFNAAQASNSPFLKSIDAALEMLPFTSSSQKAFKAKQIEALTNAVGGKVGVPAGPLTPEVMGAARSRVGQSIGDITSKFNMPSANVDELMNKLSGLGQNEFKLSASDTQRALNKSIDEVMSKVLPDGTIPGSAYRALDSFLGKQKVSGDPAHAIGAVREAARDSMYQSAPKDMQDALSLLKQQYQTIMTVAPHAAKNAEGMINPQGLLSAINSGVKNAKFGARSDLVELGQAARLLSPHANSGTAPLSNAMSALQGNITLPSAIAGAIGKPVQWWMNSPLGVAMTSQGAGGIPIAGAGLRAIEPGLTGLLKNQAMPMMAPRGLDYYFGTQLGAQ